MGCGPDGIGVPVRFSALQTYGFEDNTVVIFSSDNGPAGSMEKYLDTGHNSSGPLRGRKLDTWEGGHRVPFVIRWPGVTSPGSVSDALISQIDLMATFAAAFDYQLPKGQAEDSYQHDAGSSRSSQEPS